MPGATTTHSLKPAVKPAARLVPDLAADQSAALQVAVDEAAIRGETLVLPAGRILARSRAAWASAV